MRYDIKIKKRKWILSMLWLPRIHKKRSSSRSWKFSLKSPREFWCSFFDWVDYVEVGTFSLCLGIKLNQQHPFIVFQLRKYISSTLFQPVSFLVHGSMAEDHQDNFSTTSRGVSAIPTHLTFYIESHNQVIVRMRTEIRMI